MPACEQYDGGIVRGRSATDEYWPVKKLSPRDIIEVVAVHFEVSYRRMLIKSRIQELVMARQISMYFLRKQTTLSLKAIADLFGMDHSSVCHGIDVVRDRYTTEEIYRLDILYLEHLLEKASWAPRK